MGRLNASRHPNIPVLLGYDTESLPYHLITAFERWGNLLQLVRLSRDRGPHLTPNHLIQMILGISHALLFLEGLGFVHRAVMAENVLVGSKFVCKLSGLHFMRQLRKPPYDEGNNLIIIGMQYLSHLLRRCRQTCHRKPESETTRFNDYVLLTSPLIRL